MTVYARVQNGAVTKYPFHFRELRAAFPDVSFPAELTDARLAEWGMIAVAPAAQPAFDPITQNLVEGTPVQVGGVWTQVWNIVAASPAEVAERQASANLAADREVLKLDAWVQQFLAMTPTEAQTFINNNGATLAALRTQVARLAFIVNVLVKRELR